MLHRNIKDRPMQPELFHVAMPFNREALAFSALASTAIGLVSLVAMALI